MEIRQLPANEYDEALDLSLDVFIEYGRRDFDGERLGTSENFIYNKQLVDELTSYGTFDGESLIGMVAIKDEGKHISLLFIRPSYHGRGTGKQLFKTVILNQPVSEMTVNSSSYAIPIYRKLRFGPVCEGQVTYGMKYTPMK